MTPGPGGEITIDDPRSVGIERAVRDALEVVRPTAAQVDGAVELKLDSMQAMELIMEIEDRLDISIPVESFASARTLDQLCDMIARLHA